jgi:uncharacterized protein (DUF1330 family)
MSAYIIFLKEQTTDPEALKTYSAMTAAAASGHPIELFSAYEHHEVLEGNDLEGVVLVKFPTVAAAREWYDSPAYQKALPHRLAGAVWRAVLFEGS